VFVKPSAYESWRVWTPGVAAEASSGRESTVARPVNWHATSGPPTATEPSTTGTFGVNVQRPAAFTAIVNVMPSHAVPTVPVPLPTGVKVPGFWFAGV
jgi:hypothetical protein